MVWLSPDDNSITPPQPVIIQQLYTDICTLKVKKEKTETYRRSQYVCLSSFTCVCRDLITGNSSQICWTHTAAVVSNKSGIFTNWSILTFSYENEIISLINALRKKDQNIVIIFNLFHLKQKSYKIDFMNYVYFPKRWVYVSGFWNVSFCDIIQKTINANYNFYTRPTSTLVSQRDLFEIIMCKGLCSVYESL